MIRTLFLVFVMSFSHYTIASDGKEFSFAITAEHFQNLSGGLQTGSRSLLSADLTLLTDTQAANWWDNGQIFGYVLANYGKDPAVLTGNWQGMSNIAANNEIKLYELWYQHQFLSDDIKLLVGLHDYNAIFYSLESASHFTLPPFGIGAEVAQVSPSIFPTTALAAVLSIDLEKYYLRFALYDGIAGHPQGKRGTHVRLENGDGLFQAAELGVAVDSDYKVGLGYWQHTAEVDNPISGEISDANNGLYAIGEWFIDEQLALFVQAGVADKKKNQVARYLGAGFTFTDAWQKNDTVGLAVAQSRNSELFLQTNPDMRSSETVWELSYIFSFSQSMALQSSAYYVIDPGMQNRNGNAFSVGFRLIFAMK